MAPIARMSDGTITLRPPQLGDAQLLVAGRDQVFHRWLGPGSDDPQPTGCIDVAGEVVGWVDYDSEQEWLQAGEVNVGYHVFGHYRGNGYATRAVQLLIHHLAVRTDTRIATLVIDAENQLAGPRSPPSVRTHTHRRRTAPLSPDQSLRSRTATASSSFARHGSTTSMRILTPRTTGRSIGCGCLRDGRCG